MLPVELSSGTPESDLKKEIKLWIMYQVGIFPLPTMMPFGDL